MRVQGRIEASLLGRNPGRIEVLSIARDSERVGGEQGSLGQSGDRDRVGGGDWVWADLNSGE